MMDRISISDALAKRNEIDPFLKRMATGDEKWVIPQYCAKTIEGQTLNSDLYCQQLDRLKLAFDQKRSELANRRGVVFHQDNARLHRTATAGSDVVQSGRPIFDDFFQHLWPYIGNNTANVVFQMVKRLWLIPIDQ
ncbi:mariner transposase [Trichonephila clavipes]|nr:mariner transposase [Trichonephila clavipes]